MDGALTIYNTMTRRKEPFETIEPGKVRMYVCGVTPYASAHIGHAMSVIVFDVIRRYLEHRGYEVRHAQNFTDIDDKIIARANRDGIDPNELTERLIAEWHAETRRPQRHCRRRSTRGRRRRSPTSSPMIEGLIASGHAYQVDGDVYFRVRSFPEYGKLSHRHLDDLLAGARIEVDERKEDPLDFALWKAAKPGEPTWPSPWGPGRPGWHIECSAMCSHHLTAQVDIHGGGADLIFPHHENEIAQSRGVSRPRAVRPLLGAQRPAAARRREDVQVDRQPRAAVANCSSAGWRQAFRLMVLQSHYRAPLTYTDEGLLAAERGLDRLRAAAAPDGHRTTEGGGAARRRRGRRPVDARRPRSTPVSTRRWTTTSTRRSPSPPSSTSGGRSTALGATAQPAAAIEPARRKLVELAAVLGLELATAEAAGVGDAAPFIDLLVEVRNELRAAKQWALSDRIRDGLSALGIVVEDTATGSIWESRKA